MLSKLISTKQFAAVPYWLSYWLIFFHKFCKAITMNLLQISLNLYNKFKHNQ